MTNLEAFIEYLLEQVRNHSIYVWGAQGQDAATISESWIRRRETSTDNANRAIAFWQKQVDAGYGDVLRAFDCSGLGMYFLQNLQGLYKNDMSSNSMMGKCATLKRGDVQRGDWVFRTYTSGSSKGKAYHIGYIVDDALNVVEAKGRDDGVVTRHIDAQKSYWNAYGRPEVFAAEIEDGGTTPDPIPPGATVLHITSPLMRGDAIKHVQQGLNGLGYDCGTADGICGEQTMQGVRAFAAAHAAHVE